VIILSVIVPPAQLQSRLLLERCSYADVLGRPGFSSSFYDQAHAQIDSIILKAINELERGLTPAPADTPLVPTAKLTDEHGFLWFWHHCSWRVDGGSSPDYARALSFSESASALAASISRPALAVVAPRNDSVETLAGTFQRPCVPLRHDEIITFAVALSDLRES